MMESGIYWATYSWAGYILGGPRPLDVQGAYNRIKYLVDICDVEHRPHNDLNYRYISKYIQTRGRQHHRH